LHIVPPGLWRCRSTHP